MISRILYAQRAKHARKSINMVMRSPIYIRLVSSQHSILDSSSTTTKTQEVGNDHAILDLVQRVLGSRKRDIWNKVYQRVDDVKGKKRRLGGAFYFTNGLKRSYI